MTDGLFGVSRAREVFGEGVVEISVRHRGERITVESETRTTAWREVSERMEQLDGQAMDGSGR